MFFQVQCFSKQNLQLKQRRKTLQFVYSTVKAIFIAIQKQLFTPSKLIFSSPLASQTPPLTYCTKRSEDNCNATVNYNGGRTTMLRMLYNVLQYVGYLPVPHPLFTFICTSSVSSPPQILLLQEIQILLLLLCMNNEH